MKTIMNVRTLVLAGLCASALVGGPACGGGELDHSVARRSADPDASAQTDPRFGLHLRVRVGEQAAVPLVVPRSTRGWRRPLGPPSLVTRGSTGSLGKPIPRRPRGRWVNDPSTFGAQDDDLRAWRWRSTQRASRRDRPRVAPWRRVGRAGSAGLGRRSARHALPRALGTMASMVLGSSAAPSALARD